MNKQIETYEKPKIREYKKGRISKFKGKIWIKMYGKRKAEEIRLKVKEARAKQILPTKDTSIEIKIQNFLKQLGIEFFTHQYIKEIKHSYQCDVIIPRMNLVLECDGDYWHGNPIFFPNPTTMQQGHINRDRIRTIELIAKGFKVLRLWENEIKVMKIEDFKDKLNKTKNGI